MNPAVKIGVTGPAERPRSNVAHWNRPLHEWRSEQSMRFKPHFGWTGRIEWDGDGAAGD
jgi:hypothetical protein